MFYKATRPTPADGDMMNPQGDARGAARVDFDRYTFVEVALTPDALILASGDITADNQIASGMAKINDEVGELVSLVLIDEDDQGALLNVLFFSANVSLGTENAAPTISDANARNYLGSVNIAVADYIDLGGVKVASKANIGLVMTPVAGAKDIYVGVLNGTGTPTYTAAGLRLRLGFKR